MLSETIRTKINLSDELNKYIAIFAVFSVLQDLARSLSAVARSQLENFDQHVWSGNERERGLTHALPAFGWTVVGIYQTVLREVCDMYATTSRKPL
eukprot:g77399.t1